jgi:hypothetical protein
LRLRCKLLGVGSITTDKKRVVLHFAGTHLPPDSIRTLSRALLQCEFRTHEVVMHLSDSPAKVLNSLEEMLDILMQALPDREREARVGVAPGLSSAPMAQQVVKRRAAYRSSFSR